MYRSSINYQMLWAASEVWEASPAEVNYLIDKDIKSRNPAMI